MIGLIELQFLPPVQYFSKLLKYNTLVLDQHEHYQKRSYRNRCHIATTQGVQRLSIPLQKGKNQQMPIREVRIAYDQPWERQMEHTLRSAYQRSPFFEEYVPDLLAILQSRYEYLFDLNLDLLETLTGFLGIPKTWQLSETYHPTVPDGWTDLRNIIRPVRPPEDPDFEPIPYSQVFEDKHGFCANLSIIDLLFCMGPESVGLLKASIPS